MIEMDRFAHKLGGQTSEKIERKSVESAATMKDIGMTIEGLEHLQLYPINLKPNQTSGT